MFKVLIGLVGLQLATCSVVSFNSSSTTSSSAKPTATPTLYHLHEVQKFDLSSKVEGPIGDVAVIGGINYSPFKYIEPAGLLAESPAKAIVYSPLDDYSGIWTPAWSCFMGNSITDHIDLHSFYFGCVLASNNGVENKTHSCDIEVSAYTKSSSTPFAQQSFSFVAHSDGSYSDGSQPMVKANLKGFTGAYSIVFTIDGKPDAPTNKAIALVVDNVDVTIFTTANFTLPY